MCSGSTRLSTACHQRIERAQRHGQPDVTLAMILLATLLSGGVSLLAAYALTVRMLSSLLPWLVSLSAGLMLGTSLLELIPEAIESGADPHRLGQALVVGLLGFFVLEKAWLLRHSHHHEGDGHDHPHGFDRHQAGAGAWMIVVGDSVHNFTDGVLIAAAFLADTKLGWLTALSIATHEVPQEVGDFIVLLNSGRSRGAALLLNSASALAAVVGAVVGYLFLENAREILPLMLMVAASSLLYISLADLIPAMQRDLSARQSARQLVMMLIGVGTIGALAGLRHSA